MAWIYNHPLDVFAISSPVTKEQIHENIDAIDIILTEKECKWLNLEVNSI